MREFILLDPPEPKTIVTCGRCSVDIYDSEEYVIVYEGEIYCEDCFLEEMLQKDHIHDVLDPEQLADAFGAGYTEAGEAKKYV